MPHWLAIKCLKHGVYKCELYSISSIIYGGQFGKYFRKSRHLKYQSLNVYFLNQHVKSLYSNMEELQATIDQTVKRIYASSGQQTSYNTVFSQDDKSYTTRYCVALYIAV